jgi:hypothetical protein
MIHDAPAVQQSRELATASVAEMARAQVEARYTMALHRPRDVEAARARMLTDARRLSFAQSAEYELPRAGKKIRGASVRFVEAAMRSFGNMATNSAVVYDDADRRVIRVTVCDLETNTVQEADVVVNKTMERQRLANGQEALSERENSYGKTVYTVRAEEPADVAMLTNNAVSKMVRTLGLRLLPSDVVEDVLAVCRQTVAGSSTESPKEAARKMIDAFSGIGVKPEMIAGYIGQPLDTISPAQHAQLRHIYAAIRDGETTWSEVAAEPPEPQPADVARRARDTEQQALRAGFAPGKIAEAVRSATGGERDRAAQIRSAEEAAAFDDALNAAAESEEREAETGLEPPKGHPLHGVGADWLAHEEAVRNRAWSEWTEAETRVVCEEWADACAADAAIGGAA